MNGTRYREELMTKNLAVVKQLYTRIFDVPPPSSYKKPDIVEKLGQKFDELSVGQPVFVNDEPDPEPPPAPSEPPKPKKTGGRKKRGEKMSRRSRIVEELLLGVWDTETLAECLYIENPEWKIPQNKAAVGGTVADLRKNHHWEIIIVDQGPQKGRIFVESC